MTIPDATTVAAPQRWWKRPKVWFMIVAAILAAVLILTWAFSVLGGISLGGASANASEKGAKPTSSASPSPTAASDCPAEFVQKAPDRGAAGRFIATGIKDDKEALALLGHDAPSLLAAAKAFGVDAPSDTSMLVTSDKSCLSKTGQDLYVGVKAIMTAKITTVDNTAQVPDNFTNSGVSNEQVVYATEGGITGDRSATSWTWTDPNGTVHTVYVMHRCGNWPVVTPPAGHPTGPTDNPPPPTPQTCPPNLPHGYVDKNGKLICKDDSSVAPGTGNGSPGGGTNSDTGPGAPLPVTQPPAAPRDDPAPPAPVVPAPQPSTPSNPAPAPVPTSDPAPPPPPEPSAPPAPSPAPTCIKAPDGSC